LTLLLYIIVTYYLREGSLRPEVGLTVDVRFKRFLGELLIFRSSPTDDLVDWNSGVSVLSPYVHKKCFRFPSNLVCV